MQSILSRIVLFSIQLLSFAILSNGCSGTCECKKHTSIDQNQTTVDTEDSLLRHVVIFKFKDESSFEDIKEVHETFLELPKVIPEIKSFEWGLNDSPEDFHQGFTHCYLITFESEYDRDSVYTPHPAHQNFVSVLQPHLEKVFVVDYWSQY